MLWLIRHGESTANIGAVTHNYAAIPLTERGVEQAATVAAAFEKAPDWIGLSPFLRARQTAAPLLARFPGASVTDLDVQEFTYLAPASCYGVELAASRPLVDAYWARLDPHHCEGDGAETFAALCARARAFLAHAALQPGFGVVFTHEQFIRAVLAAVIYPDVTCLTEQMRRFFALRTALPIPNAAIVRLRIDNGRWWTGGVDAGHLTAAT